MRNQAPSPSVVGEVARHWHRAGDLPRALESSLLAGEASMRMYAFADAQTNYLRALELLEQVPSDLDRVDLNTRAAECSILVGDSASAVRLVESALAEVDDPPARAALFERLGSFHYLAGNGDASDKAFRQALALLPPGETSTLAARVYAGLGLLSAAWSRLDVAEEACAHALRISRAVGARREEGMTLNALGLIAAARGDADGGVALLRESLVIAREVAEPERRRCGVHQPQPHARHRRPARRGRDAVPRGDRRAEPDGSGSPERKLPSLQHQRRPDQGRPAHRSRRVDRGGACSAAARHHGRAGPAVRGSADLGAGRPPGGVGAV